MHGRSGIFSTHSDTRWSMVPVRLDHLMWGAPSLRSGTAEARRLFSLNPAAGGVHPGLGTCNALLSLGEDQYLEVIAPDHEQELAGTLGAKLATLEAPGLVTWAAAAADLDAVAAAAGRASLAVRGPVLTSRQAPDGRVLRWRLLFLSGHAFGGLVPFFIDWMDTPHPARTNPLAGRFLDLDVRTPHAGELNAIYASLGIAIRAAEAATPDVAARIASGGRTITLRGAKGFDGWSL
jgi:hypothetical protein